MFPAQQNPSSDGAEHPAALVTQAALSEYYEPGFKPEVKEAAHTSKEHKSKIKAERCTHSSWSAFPQWEKGEQGRKEANTQRSEPGASGQGRQETVRQILDDIT